MKQTKKLYIQFAGSCCLLLFVFLGYCIKFYEQSNWIQAFDHLFTNLIRFDVNATLTKFYQTITVLGNPEMITIICLICLIFLVAKKQYLEVGYLILNVLIVAGLCNQVLKYIIVRIRPSLEHLVTAHGYSFPSGHAMGSTLMYGTLALLGIYYFRRNQFWRRASYLLFILPLLIGMSRVYLGVHYPTDIVGGWLFGIGWLCLTYPIYRQLRFVKDFQGR